LESGYAAPSDPFFGMKLLRLMNICESNQAVSDEVRRFMENVHDIKEESITDFLVWKWRELDKRFNFLRIHPFNHQDESGRTGADFDLELWLVGRRHHLSFAVQAKKFINQYDSYVKRLRYPGGTKAQMSTLLKYASSTKCIPFYFIYSMPQSSTRTMCGREDSPLGAIFTAHARKLEEFADGKHGRRVTKDQLLSVTNPFHCMFCCPLARDEAYFRHYFGQAGESDVPHDRRPLPAYVRILLQRTGGETPQIADIDAPRQFRFIGVYNLQGE
jgi:hypothetical protein